MSLEYKNNMNNAENRKTIGIAVGKRRNIEIRVLGKEISIK